MAPLSADDVVYRGETGENSKQVSKFTLQLLLSLTILRKLVKRIPKLILEYKQQTRLDPFTFASALLWVSKNTPPPIQTFL